MGTASFNLFIPSTGQDNSAFENVSNVAENFDNDFLNNEPRDILLVIDTSSSIYVADFEVKKPGIQSWLTLQRTIALS